MYSMNGQKFPFQSYRALYDEVNPILGGGCYQRFHCIDPVYNPDVPQNAVENVLSCKLM